MEKQVAQYDFILTQTIVDNVDQTIMVILWCWGVFGFDSATEYGQIH